VIAVTEGGFGNWLYMETLSAFNLMTGIIMQQEDHRQLMKIMNYTGRDMSKSVELIISSPASPGKSFVLDKK
jgi:hypothetical protein